MNVDVTDEHLVAERRSRSFAPAVRRMTATMRDKGRWLAVAAVALFAAGAWGQHFKVDAASSEVHFTLGSFDGPVNGTFKATAGDFTLDPASGAMTGSITVDASSGDSGNKKRDKKMTNDQMKAQ